MTHRLTAVQQRLYDLVLAAENGVTMREAAHLSGRGWQRLRRRMKSLRDKGLVVSAGTHKAPIWCTPERQARIRAELKKRTDAERRTRERERDKARREETTDSNPLPVRQTIRPAAGIAPAFTRAPRSIFDLALACTACADPA